ncbi:MAG: O-antigen ligase family protein [bacterium]
MINKFKTFKWALLFIILAELLSLSGYLLPNVNKAVFILIVIITLFVSLKDLKYGIYILLAELVIGSKGYLFYWETDQAAVSIRIALWLIIMSVWIAKALRYRQGLQFLKSRFKYYWLALFVGVVLAGLGGLASGNNYSNIFFDANNWLYLAIIFPIYQLFNEKKLKILWQVVMAGVSWIAIKTYILLFFFSHNLFSANSVLYGWVRNSGIGEVTMTQSGFFRIFFQSHIFIVLAVFGILLLLAMAVKKSDKKRIIKYSIGLTLLISLVITSLSRSFWAGSLIGLMIFWPLSISIYKLKLKKFLSVNGLIVLSGLMSLILIAAIIKFPYPEPVADFSATTLIDRANLTTEAAASSRWSLLPELWKSIKHNPVSGQGFGATVTYISSDPRVVQNTADHSYTTYAFEWGWLDIWLKFGLWGLLAYLALIIKLVHDGLIKRSSKQPLVLAWTMGLAVLAVVHIFTPYLNHPLGLGYLILASLIIDISGENKPEQLTLV